MNPRTRSKWVVAALLAAIAVTATALFVAMQRDRAEFHERIERVQPEATP